MALKTIAAAPPDGHTLFLGTTGSMTINPALFSDVDFSAAKNLEPIALLATIPNLLAIAPAVPAKNLAEFVAYARGNPGKLAYGAGNGTPPHLLGEYIRAKSGLDLVFVPYPGGAQALPDLLGGRIQMVGDSPAPLLPHIAQGKIKPLVVTSQVRLPELPDIQTLAEAGIAGYPPQTWMGLIAPPGTPNAIIVRLNKVANEVIRSAETKTTLAKLGFATGGGSAQQFAALIASDAAQWAAVSKAAQVRLKLKN
jgi:tripartite-type tricarboxylate transporter receptor subunit TctC